MTKNILAGIVFMTVLTTSTTAVWATSNPLSLENKDAPSVFKCGKQDQTIRVSVLNETSKTIVVKIEGKQFGDGIFPFDGSTAISPVSYSSNPQWVRYRPSSTTNYINTAKKSCITQYTVSVKTVTVTDPLRGTESLSSETRKTCKAPDQKSSSDVGYTLTQMVTKVTSNGTQVVLACPYKPVF